MSLDFYTTQEVRRCRKAQRCDECRTTIPAGTPLRRYAFRHDGVFCSGCVHPDCADWANKVVLEGPDEGRPFLCDVTLDEDVDVVALKAAPPTREVYQRLTSAWRLLIDEVCAAGLPPTISPRTKPL